MTIKDVNEIAPGMMFSSEVIVYNDFTLLRTFLQKVQMGASAMLFVTTGKISFTLNDSNMLVTKDNIVLVKKGDFISDIMFSTDCNGWVFASGLPFALECSDTRAFKLFSELTDENRVFQISEDMGRIIVGYGKIIELKHGMGITDVRMTLSSLLHDVMQNIEGSLTEHDTRHNTAPAVFKKFTSLLLATNPKPREVKWYADALGVTPKYLTTVVKRLSRKTVSEWIDEVVMAEVRKNLIHTDDTIREIAKSLGFNNAAFFGKYVRNHSGMTPVELRQHLRANKETI